MPTCSVACSEDPRYAFIP